MAALIATPLNAETALPDEREEQQLPPKSYADAVEQGPPKDGANGANVSNGTNGANGGGTGPDGSKQTGHMASVLRIVDTGAPQTADKQEERPQFERQESKHEYSATVGLYSSCPHSTLLTPPKGPR
jgi:2-acylglycerol O-acyltransferase 2